MNPRPITLDGNLVRLEPLSSAHALELNEALALALSISEWRTEEPPASLAEMEAMIAAALEAQSSGQVVAFTQREQASGKAVGMTTYMDIRRRDRGLEIG